MGNASNLPEIGTQQVKEAFTFTDEVVEGYPNRLTGTESCHKAGPVCQAMTSVDEVASINVLPSKLANPLVVVVGSSPRVLDHYDSGGLE